MTERIEETILRNLIYDEEFYRKVVPFVKADYFIELHEKVIFEEIQDFSTKYDKTPTKEVLNINLQNRNDLTEETFQQSLNEIKNYGDDWVDKDWVVDATEKWCQDRAIYLALMQSIKIADGGDSKLDKGAIPSILQEALAVSFDEHIGHDYIEQSKERYEFYHKTEKKSPLIWRSLIILQKAVSLIRLSTSLLLVQVSGKVYSCAMWLVPVSQRARTFSTLHVKWQRRKLLNELTQIFSTVI